jgi:uncharacterized iron-regulated membrane protein
MRLAHRYLGFFLTGIMAVYALSGVVLIFRDTDLLKRDTQVQAFIQPQLTPQALGKELHIRDLQVTYQDQQLMLFEQGTYHLGTGEANYTTKKLPWALDKMTHLHKANTGHPLFWLNIFFGASLLFFVVSAFWMFRPKSKIFQVGLYYTAGGIVLTGVLLFM